MNTGNKFFYEVVAYSEDKEVFRDIVKSTSPNQAIVNVMVNKYREPVSKVEVEQVDNAKAKEKTVSIRMTEEHYNSLEKLRQLKGHKTISETLRWITEQE
jgi:nucleoside diphosphate kinase